MTLMGLAAIALIAIGMVIYGLSTQPTRWTFEVRGYVVEFRKYADHEVVSVEGVDQAGTQSRGLVDHRAVLPDGATLWIRTIAHGLVSWRVDLGAATVQDEAPSRDEDPRVLAARVLLVDIAAVDSDSATALELAIRTSIEAEYAAHAAAAAHDVLGGTPYDTSVVVAKRVQEVELLLSAVRTLHLRVASLALDEADDVRTAVRDLSARLEATIEVDALKHNE